MFTGIIEETGKIKRFTRHSIGAEILVECKKVLEDTKVGDSISINGCCQTVVSITGDSFCANVSDETLQISNFLDLKIGDIVNLERALTPESRMGGHIVQGHVDSTGKLVKLDNLGNFYDMNFEVSSDSAKYIVYKGSIAVNGVSLTVSDIKENTFKVSVIPHTYENTSLKYLKLNDIVNIETDILGRYIEKFLYVNNNNSKIDEKFLLENGFI